MTEPLRLFVSATNDLEAERAAIGRALAHLPVAIGIEIRRTPAGSGALETIHEAIANVDRVYFLLGQDITAPAGAEWQMAWTLERPVLPLRRAGPRTPAAREFLRGAPLAWRTFRSSAEAARRVAFDAAETLLHPANRYGLTVAELERLQAHAAALRAELPAETHDPEPGGAQGGGVLLDAGRRAPLHGVPLDADDR